jgi:hypothetical protein
MQRRGRSVLLHFCVSQRGGTPRKKAAKSRITDEYVEVSGLYTKIFDVESLASLNWNRTYQGKMESYSAIGSSMKQFYTNISADFNKSISAGADLGVFSASVERQFGFFAGASYEKTSNEIFYTTAQLFSTNLVEIDERANLSQFTSVLSDSFLSDISKLEDGTIDAKTIIEKYGTHSILAGYYGGRIESNYYLRNTGTVWEANVETKYKNGIKASFDKLASAGTNIEFSIKAEVLDKSEETTEHFNAYGIGGANFSALTQADFMNHYKDWVDSMNDLSLEKSVIVALPQRSLVAIWDLLPINYLKAKEKLSDYFNCVATQTHSEFLAKFERSYSSSEISEEKNASFGGGSGEESNPYIINTKEHLLNIAKVLPSIGYNGNTAGKYFALGKDLNLGVWESKIIFNGNLDGRGKTISYAQTIDTDNDYYGGVFKATAGATITNLLLDVDISRTSETSKNGYVGGLVGEASNSIFSRIGVRGNINLVNKKSSGICRAGGIIGYLRAGSVHECKTEIEISGSAYRPRFGGIVGEAETLGPVNSITIENCYMINGSIVATNSGDSVLGGIVGRVERGSNGTKTYVNIISCYADFYMSTQGYNGAMVGLSEGNGVTKLTAVYWNSSRCAAVIEDTTDKGAVGRTDMRGTDYSGGNWRESNIWVLSTFDSPRLAWER